MELVDGAFVSSMTQIEDCNDGILLLSFKSLEIAKLYLRTADYTTKSACGIYEIENNKGRLSYKIFPGNDELNLFLKKNKDKKCRQMMPVFSAGKYKEYPHTEVRKLTPDEIKQYMSER